MEEKILARFEHMRKYFGVTKAVDDVTITVERGEIRGLIGENGSGKSTFLSMVAGILKPDSGTMTLSGKHYAPKDLTDATRSGVSMIVQEINTLPGLTVAENIFLGREPANAFGIIRRRQMAAQAATEEESSVGARSDTNVPEPARERRKPAICRLLTASRMVQRLTSKSFASSTSGGIFVPGAQVSVRMWSSMRSVTSS